MENLDMEDAFLGFLYEANFSGRDSTLDQIDKWLKTTSFNRTEFWKNYESMIKLDLLRFIQDEANVRLTPKGTLRAEKTGLVCQDLICRSRLVRKKLMQTLASHLTDKGSMIDISQLAAEAGLSEQESIGNVHLLISMGYARWQVRPERIVISPSVCSKMPVTVAA